MSEPTTGELELTTSVAESDPTPSPEEKCPDAETVMDKIADYCKHDAVVDFDKFEKQSPEELRKEIVVIPEGSAMFFEHYIQKQLYCGNAERRGKTLSQTIFQSCMAQSAALANEIIRIRKSAVQARETKKVCIKGEGTPEAVYIPLDLTYIRRLRMQAVLSHKAMIHWRLVVLVGFFADINSVHDDNFMEKFVDELTYPLEIAEGSRISITKENMKHSMLVFLKQIALQQVQSLDFVDGLVFPHVSALVEKHSTQSLPYELTDEDVDDIYSNPSNTKA